MGSKKTKRHSKSTSSAAKPTDSTGALIAISLSSLSLFGFYYLFTNALGSYALGGTSPLADTDYTAPLALFVNSLLLAIVFRRLGSAVPFSLSLSAATLYSLIFFLIVAAISPGQPAMVPGFVIIPTYIATVYSIYRMVN